MYPLQEDNRITEEQFDFFEHFPCQSSHHTHSIHKDLLWNFRVFFDQLRTVNQ